MLMILAAELAWEFYRFSHPPHNKYPEKADRDKAGGRVGSRREIRNKKKLLSYFP